MVLWELPYLLVIVCCKQARVIVCSDLPGATDYALVSESELTRGVKAPSCFFEPFFVRRLAANKTQRFSGHTWNTVFSFGLHYTKNMWTDWRGSRERPQR